MSLFNLITSAFVPVTRLIDSMHTSDEEKLEKQNEWAIIQSRVISATLEAETRLAEAQASIVKAEATGHSWLQRNWRPMTMLVFVFIIFNNYILLPYASALGMPIVPLDLPDTFFTLLTVGLGGYVVGRSGEKIAKNLTLKRSA